MNFQLIFWLVLAAVTSIIVPLVMVLSMRDYFRGKGSERRGSGGISAGVGAALQELDRIMTRPSVEYTIETENAVKEREDDTDGE